MIPGCCCPSKLFTQRLHILCKATWTRELLLFSRSVMSDFLWPQGLQHAGLPCPSFFPEVCSNSCPLNKWCHPTISSSVPTSLSSLTLARYQGLSNELALRIRWSKHGSFSFSINHLNECSELISFMIDWFDLLVVQGTLKSILQHYQFHS